MLKDEDLAIKLNWNVYCVVEYFGHITIIKVRAKEVEITRDGYYVHYKQQLLRVLYGGMAKSYKESVDNLLVYLRCEKNELIKNTKDKIAEFDRLIKEWELKGKI